MTKIAALRRRVPRNEEITADGVDASTELGIAMVKAALSPSTLARLARPGALGLVLVAPTSEHAAMVEDALEAILPKDTYIIQVPGMVQTMTEQKLFNGLQNSKVVIAVCSSLDQVSPSFRIMAEEIIAVGPHDVNMVRRVLRTVLRRPVPRFPSGFLLHPDPDQVCRCIMPSLSPAQVVSALARLGGTIQPTTHDALPPLEECVEFGEARSWGLLVKRDLALWKAGQLTAGDLDTACLLTSPPGYGKTYFARVLAQSLGVPLIQITAGSLYVDDGHLGDVLRELRRQFSAASAAAPAVLLLDELDSFSRRDARDNNRSYNVSVINELLTLIDGATVRAPGLVLVGATNMPDWIDPALRRPGRLSRTITMSLPDAAGIEHVLRVHLRGELGNAPLGQVVRLATGASPAMLMDAVRTARQYARAEDRPLAEGDIAKALAPSECQDQAFLRRIALHEAGHAMACLLLPDAPHLRSMSLMQGQHHLGHIDASEPPGANTRSRMEAKIMTFLAGRAAENLLYGDDFSDGAAEDLRLSTHLIGRMHAQFGMTGNLVHYENISDLLLRDRDFAKRAEEDLQRLLQEVTDLLGRYQVHLMSLAFELVRRRVLTGPEALQIVEAVHARVLHEAQVTSEADIA